MQKIKIIQEQEHIQNNDNKFNNKMDLGLTDKVCMVTAASKGLGRASALALAMNGACVCISSRTEKDIQAAAKMIAEKTGKPENILALSADITEQEGIDKVYDAMIAKWGRCDILVSNCGGK